jgi:hypothetical protein
MTLHDRHITQIPTIAPPSVPREVKRGRFRQRHAFQGARSRDPQGRAARHESDLPPWFAIRKRGQWATAGDETRLQDLQGFDYTGWLHFLSALLRQSAIHRRYQSQSVLKFGEF